MTNFGFPIAFDDISDWATNVGVSLEEARRRFAQYGVLRGIASSRRLRTSVAFKGGNALDFIWCPNRSTLDLDFSADPSIRPEDSPENWIATTLQQAVDTSTPSLGTVYRLQRLRRQPPGENKTFVSINANFAYALQDEPRLQRRIHAGEPLSRVIPLEISLNEVLCDVADVYIDETRQLRVCTVDDIVAEKLRALLQQTVRNRVRSQDLLDIVVLLRSQAVSPDRVAGFLQRKAAARHVPVSRSAFRDPEVIQRTSQDYSALQSTVRRTFIEFDVALQELFQFTDRLAIPD